MKPKLPPTWLIGLGVVLPLLVGAAFYRHANWNDVHVVNGFPEPLQIRMGGQTQTVPASGRLLFPDVRAGTQLLEAHAKSGEEVESLLVIVEGHGDTVVYNVAGAAPIVWQRIEYASHQNAGAPRYEVLCGQRLIRYDDIDYPFTQPPNSISTKGGGSVYRTRLVIEEGGVGACQAYEMQQGRSWRPDTWQALLVKMKSDSSVEQRVASLVANGEEAQALLAVEAAFAASKDSLSLRRFHQELLERAGRRDEAFALYEQRARRPEATAEDLYLLTRLMPLEERLAAQAEALRRLPDSIWLHWALARGLKAKGEYGEALMHLNDLHGTPDQKELASELVQLRAETLVHLGRIDEAERLALAFESENEDLWLLQLRQDLRLLTTGRSKKHAARVGLGSADGGVAQIPLWKERWLEAFAEQPETQATSKTKGRDDDVPMLVKARKLVRTTYADPVSALHLVAEAEDAELSQLPLSIHLLLLTESWRTGDRTAAAKLTPKQGQRFEGASVADIERFLLDGTLSDDVHFQDEESLAVLWFARGRRLATLGQSPGVAWKKAAELDVFHRTATRALAKWPAPEPVSSSGDAALWSPVE